MDTTPANGNCKDDQEGDSFLEKTELLVFTPDLSYTAVISVHLLLLSLHVNTGVSITITTYMTQPTDTLFTLRCA